MGAWGAGSFENDDAMDWLDELCDASDAETVRTALLTVTENAAYLEAPDCSIGLAAAEIVAALKGTPSGDMPDSAKECLPKLKMTADHDLVSLASRAVERIKTDSELKELWDESESTDEWYDVVRNLESRLK